MSNRRNFYRILRVQPDATHDVIQQSYRSLMQKLRLHPDLGGEDRDAGIINQAYATLRNPKMRAAYDAELLSRYNIKTLSAGGVFSSNTTTSDEYESTYNLNNRRNYYRILHIQNDAEPEIIKASYRALSTQLTGKDQQLLDEAFYVVGNQRRRRQYDTLLRLHTHRASIGKLQCAEHLTIQPDSNITTPLSTVAQTSQPTNSQEIAVNQAYQSAIKYYCKFCKTPYTNGNFMELEQFCRECSSPLSLPADIFANTPRRSLPRIQQSENANIYEYWPGNPIQVLLEDLSPTGLNFSLPQSLDISQVIKVDANHFNAVAQIVYCRNDNATNSIGASFLTIEFLRTTGSFLSTSA